jgi:triacylglycerol lipase
MHNMPFVFEPDATSFSIVNARLLGHAAAVSYDEAEACRTWAVNNGLDQAFDFFSNQDTQGFVAQNDKVILVAFRGTQPNHPADWLVDFEAPHVHWDHPAGKVHKGFHRALMAIWGQTLDGKEILPKRLLDRGNRTVWITGHSLGGALAVMCAAQARLAAGIPVQGVYTFGQPRVGTEEFSMELQAALGSRIFRFINNRDIVPRVPLFSMRFNHCGTEIFFDPEGRQETRPSAVEDLSAALRLARHALDLDGAHKIAEAFRSVATALSHGELKERELQALGDPKAILARGTQNIADHSMTKCYLVRLGAG